mgnify:CR=1 FL=1
MAMDLQLRATEHGAWRHNTHPETQHGSLAPLLTGVKNGGITFLAGFHEPIQPEFLTAPGTPLDWR